jgi:hypothetical protein
MVVDLCLPCGVFVCLFFGRLVIRYLLHFFFLCFSIIIFIMSIFIIIFVIWILIFSYSWVGFSFLELFLVDVNVLYCVYVRFGGFNVRYFVLCCIFVVVLFWVNTWAISYCCFLVWGSGLGFFVVCLFIICFEW